MTKRQFDVPYYQEKLNQIVPGRYEVLRQVLDSALKAKFIFEIRDTKRDVVFQYSIISLIGLLRKNPERLFALKAEEHAISRQVSKKYTGVKDLVASSGFSESYIRSTLRKMGEEQGTVFLAYPRAGTAIEGVVEGMLGRLGVKFESERKFSENYRPDFTLPGSKVILECDGLYWHSDANPRLNREIKDSQYYHRNKKLAYTKEGYRSLFFREDEIKNRPKVVESIIRNAIGMCTRKVGARKTKVVPLTNTSFFIQNHLMGGSKGPRYGLEFEGEVVAAIQVRWIDEVEQPGLLDVGRFCTLPGVSVPGGFDKLISHVIQEMNPTTIQTFIDLRYGEGTHLSYQGWTQAKDTYLSFKWTDGIKTYHRRKYTGNTGYDHGLFKIWDCGQAKWILDITKERVRVKPPDRSVLAPVLAPNLVEPISANPPVQKYNRKFHAMGITRYTVTSLQTRHTAERGKGYGVLTLLDNTTGKSVTTLVSNAVAQLRANPNYEFTDKFGDKTSETIVPRYQKQINDMGLESHYKVLEMVEQKRHSQGTYYSLRIRDLERNYTFVALTSALFSLLRKNPNHSFRPEK